MTALVMAALVIIDQIWGVNIGAMSEEAVTIILAILTPILVWLIPNRPKAR